MRAVLILAVWLASCAEKPSAPIPTPSHDAGWSTPFDQDDLQRT